MSAYGVTQVAYPYGARNRIENEGSGHGRVWGRLRRMRVRERLVMRVIVMLMAALVMLRWTLLSSTTAAAAAMAAIVSIARVRYYCVARFITHFIVFRRIETS